MKIVFITFGLVVILVFAISLIQDVTFRSKENFVDINKLISNPGLYNQKAICTSGNYRSEFEVSELFTPTKEQRIWIQTAVHPNLINQIGKHQVNVCGKFWGESTGDSKSGQLITGKYGQMSRYQFQITALNPGDI